MWIDKKPADHVCVKPSYRYNQIGVGSIWQCDECGDQWKWDGRDWNFLLFRRRLKEPHEND